MERVLRLVSGPDLPEASHSFSGTTVLVPVLDGTRIENVARLLRERAGLEEDADLRRRAEALERAARRFLDPEDFLRQRAEACLPSLTGFSREMIRESLPRVFRAVTADAILEILSRRASADRRRPGRGRVLPLVAVLSAGNVPGVFLPKTVLALAAGSSCLVKAASGEPLLASFFADALAEEESSLAARLGVVWWEGGEREIEAAVCRSVESVVAYGSDGTMAALEKLHPPRFFPHGHRLSVGVVRMEDLVDRAETVRRAALDVALYDQLGCLSPQAFFLIGGTYDDQRGFGEALAAELERLATDLPRGRTPENVSIAIRRFRDQIEWQELGHGKVHVWASSPGTDWTVILEREIELGANPLGRTAILRPLRQVKDLPQALGPWEPRIESVGVAPWPDDGIARTVRDLGIPRVVPLGRMQEPTLDWRASGRHPLAGIVTGL